MTTKSAGTMTLDKVVELITIGREILDGRVVDTNSVKMAEELRAIGLIPRYGQRVDDEIGRVVDAYAIAAGRSDFVLVTGGLGPTSDDLTAAAFARYLGEELVLRDEALTQIQEYLRSVGREITPQVIEAQRKQAMLPPSCFVIPNPLGTAPGFGLERDGRSWYFMPGVPREMVRMLRQEVLPRLPALPGYRALTWVTHFTAESQLQQRLAGLEAALPKGVEITYQSRYPENHIGLCGSSITEDLCAEMDRILGGDAWCGRVPVSEIKPIEHAVVAALALKKIRVRLDESGTGGLIASRMQLAALGTGVFAGAVVRPDGVRLDSVALESPVPGSQSEWTLFARLDQSSAGSGVRVELMLNPGAGRTMRDEMDTPIRLDAERARVFAAQKAFALLLRASAIMA